MAPCVETPPRRRFTLRFKDGSSKTIRADKITRSPARPATPSSATTRSWRSTRGKTCRGGAWTIRTDAMADVLYWLVMAIYLCGAVWVALAILLDR